MYSHASFPYTLIKKSLWVSLFFFYSFLLVSSNDVTIIWGSTGAISNEANNTITLPIALKNRLYSISALAYSVDGKTMRNEYGIYILQMSKASFLTSLRAFNGVAINVPIYYMAVGF